MNDFVVTGTDYERMRDHRDQLLNENNELLRDAARYCIQHVTKRSQYQGCPHCEIERLTKILKEYKIYPGKL